MKNIKQSQITQWMHTVLTIAQLHSPQQSAQHLGISITTVYRHIDALEKALEFKIFIRNHSGWELRKEALFLLKTSTQIEQLLLHAENEMRHAAGTESGNLRIAVSDDFAHYIIKHLKAFRQIYPKIMPELIISNVFSDLKNAQADVAIRPDMDPGDELIGQRIAEMKHAFYASRSYIKEHGIVKNHADFNRHHICGYGSALKNYTAGKWQHRHISPDSIIAKFDTTSAIVQATIEGLGIGLLPCFVGDGLSELTSVLQLENELTIDIWLVTTVATRKRPKVSAFFDYFAKAMKADKAKFSGSVMRS